MDVFGGVQSVYFNAPAENCHVCAGGILCLDGGGLLLTCGAHRGGASIVWSVPCLDASKAAWVCGPPDPCIMVFRPSTRASSGTS